MFKTSHPLSKMTPFLNTTSFPFLIWLIDINTLKNLCFYVVMLEGNV